MPPQALNTGSSSSMGRRAAVDGAPTMAVVHPRVVAAAAIALQPSAVSDLPLGARSSTSPSNASASLTAQAAPLPPSEKSRTKLSRCTSPRPASSRPSGGSFSLEGSPTAVATSKATTHKLATAAAPVTSGAPTPGSVSDSGSPRRASTISRPGSYPRRPPVPPGRPPPQGVTTVPPRATKVGAKSVTKSRVNPRAKTGAKAGDKTVVNQCAKTGAKADDKTTAKRSAKAGDKSAAKPSVKTAVKPSATAAAETTVKAGAGTSIRQRAVEGAENTPVGVSAGDALPTAGNEPPPAVIAQPPSGGRSARRGQYFFGLAADGLRCSVRSGKRTAVPKPASVLQTKRAAARYPNASAPRAPKRSRRLVDRECDNTLSPPHPVGGRASQTVSPGSPVGEYPPRKETPKSTHARRRPGEGAPSDKHELCDRKFTCPRRRPRGDTHASPSYPIRSPRTLGKPSSDTLKGPTGSPLLRAHWAHNPEDGRSFEYRLE